MTKKIEYICNFCRNTHFDDAPIYGALWGGKELSLVVREKAENHLCKTCAREIAKAYHNLKQ